MYKYRCVKADRHGGRSEKQREYNENSITDARKRACKMIHGDKNTSVYIFDYGPFIKGTGAGYGVGYAERVFYDYERNRYWIDGVNGHAYISPKTGYKLKLPIY